MIATVSPLWRRFLEPRTTHAKAQSARHPVTDGFGISRYSSDDALRNPNIFRIRRRWKSKIFARV